MADLDREAKPVTQATARGKLRIGDDWNAITIIALSQSNPLKAIAELVENSIDANARTVTITRGREHGRHFLAIRDDGEGVPRGDDGRPDFRYVAPDEPGLTRLKVSVSQRDVVCEAEALITVTHELLAQFSATTVPSQGLPGYTFERTPGESRRSRFDATRNVIVINNGHRDFVYASRNKSLKLRYLVRLYAKELVLRNFVGLPADQLLERMVELSLRTEEHL